MICWIIRVNYNLILKRDAVQLIKIITITSLWRLRIMNWVNNRKPIYSSIWLCIFTTILAGCGSGSDDQVRNIPQPEPLLEEPLESEDSSGDNDPSGDEDSIALSVCRSAVFPSQEWQTCELQNYAKATGASARHLLDLGFQTKLLEEGVNSVLASAERLLVDPFWNSFLNACGSVMPHCVGDPYRHPITSDWYKSIGTVYPVNFYDNEGARLSGRVWAPKNHQEGKVYPAVIIVNGSVQAPETLYWWAAQLLVENGYLVMTFDPRGQGYSDSTAPGGQLGSNYNSVVFRRNLIDAIDFFYSTPNTLYPHNLPEAPGPTFDFNLAKTTKFNPIHDLLDLERLGIAGHSMGATAVSVVQGETDWQGTMHDDNPVKVAVAWDNLMLAGSLDGIDVVPRVPSMGQSGDYFLVPLPYLEPPSENKNAGVELWRDSGIDTYQVNISGATHYEWSLIHPFPSSYWEGGKIIAPDGSDNGEGWANPMAQYYTLAWFDRYLKIAGEKGYEDADERLLNDKIFRERMSWYHPSKRAYKGRDGRMHSCEYIALGC
jgi:pimeloyl-ACP methyl ester carboxylesterase